jgi:branched-chain amino acid transport system ATP-binding protein
MGEAQGILLEMAVLIMNTQQTSTPIVQVNNLEVMYNGAIRALNGVSIVVPPGGFVSVLGANGAGKTSLVRAITGNLGVVGGAITAGSVSFEGQDVTSATSRSIVKLGVGQVPEGRLVFARLTVEENLLCGAATRTDKEAMAADMERVWKLFPQIANRRKEQAGWLSGGEQQMVAVGRAIMTSPRLLILDEMSLGLGPLVVREIFDLLVRLNREEGLSVLMIEQNARLAMESSQYSYVLETGRTVLEGPTADLRRDPHVEELYLGGAGDAREVYEALKRFRRKK